MNVKLGCWIPFMHLGDAEKVELRRHITKHIQLMKKGLNIGPMIFHWRFQNAPRILEWREYSGGIMKLNYKFILVTNSTCINLFMSCFCSIKQEKMQEVVANMRRRTLQVQGVSHKFEMKWYVILKISRRLHSIYMQCPVKHRYIF